MAVGLHTQEGAVDSVAGDDEEDLVVPIHHLRVDLGAVPKLRLVEAEAVRAEQPLEVTVQPGVDSIREEVLAEDPMQACCPNALSEAAACLSRKVWETMFASLLFHGGSF